MVREFRNDNGITYEIIAENKELDRTLLREYSNDGRPLYIVAWGINYQRHYWVQGHYFLEDFKAACNYLNGEENKNENPNHYVSIKDFIRTLSKDTQIAIYNTSKSEWMVGCDCAYDTVEFWDWSSLPDDVFVENVELHHDPDAGDGLWIDVFFGPRN
nr:MAG TPA: hypothetical protein [Siphoviridae sp. ctngg6]